MENLAFLAIADRRKLLSVYDGLSVLGASLLGCGG